jgi:hypothetical protein
VRVSVCVCDSGYETRTEDRSIDMGGWLRQHLQWQHKLTTSTLPLSLPLHTIINHHRQRQNTRERRRSDPGRENNIWNSSSTSTSTSTSTSIRPRRSSRDSDPGAITSTRRSSRGGPSELGWNEIRRRNRLPPNGGGQGGGGQGGGRGGGGVAGLLPIVSAQTLRGRVQPRQNASSRHRYALDLLGQRK